MTHSRKALRVLGLLSAMLIVGAIGAGAAQAEPGAAWDVNGMSLNELPELLPEVEVREILPLPEGSLEPGKRHVALLVPISETHTLEILCAKAELINVKLGTEGLVDPGGQVDFSECKSYLVLEGMKEELEACEPNAKGTHEGLIITQKGHGLLQLVEGKPVTVLTPVEGETLAYIEMSEECAFGEKIAVNGQLALYDNEGIEGEREVHMAEEGAGTSLTANGKPATIDGSVGIALAGVHHGLSWNGLPK